LLQYGGANADWVEASGSTYNLVEKIETIISTIQGKLPAKIIFTTTSTNPPNVTWTVPASVNSITIEASSSGAPGTPDIATSTSGVYQGGGGGGSGQVGNITIPVSEGMELTISLGALSPPGDTVAYGTVVEINGGPITCNGASGNTSGMDGGNGATLNTNVFCSYSCGGSGGTNSNGSGASGTGGTGLTSFFDGGALAEWGVGNQSGYGGLNAGSGAAPILLSTGAYASSGTPGAGGGALGGAYLKTYADGRLGCGGCGGFQISTAIAPPGSGGSGYVKLRLY